MDQKFSGEVGQVAGRDVKNSGAQASVNIHLHNGVESKRYISDRQRRAIGAKVFELEAKTGVEKLMVYRRLMTRFKFRSMDEMPRELFERVMRYLDGWIRNGTAEQGASSFPQREIKEQAPAPEPQATSTEPRIEHVAPAILAATVPVSTSTQSGIAPAQTQKRQRSRHVVASAAVAAVAIVVVSYVTVNRPDAPTVSQMAAPPLHCEYGGHRYTVGSIVRQEGLRQRCETTAERVAAWQPVTSNGRR